MASAQTNFTNWNIQLGKQKDLLQQLPEKVTKAKKRLQELQAEQETDAVHKEESLLTEAQRLLNLAEQSKLQAEINLSVRECQG